MKNSFEIQMFKNSKMNPKMLKTLYKLCVCYVSYGLPWFWYPCESFRQFEILVTDSLHATDGVYTCFLMAKDKHVNKCKYLLFISVI